MPRDLAVLIHFGITVESLRSNFGKTRKWQTILDEVRARMGFLNNLLKSRSNKERDMIGTVVMERKYFHLGRMTEQMDKYLNDIK